MIPLLLFSDHPCIPSGLARITRDLATRVATNLGDVFKVATIGFGGPGSSRLPFHQYHWHFSGDWVIHELPEIWEDFAQRERGIFMTIHDASRMLWLARPDIGCNNGRLKDWLKRKPFSTWGYFPIDATGIHDKLTLSLQKTYVGYDRILAYSEWALGVLLHTAGNEFKEPPDFLPHGIDASVFYPRDKKHARDMFCEHLTGDQSNQFRVTERDLLIGIVATNQPRKDFALGMEVVAELAKTRPLKLWIHTDVLERSWSIPLLLHDFGGIDRTLVTTAQLPDEKMAWAYSACDVTLGIGLGEGFGYPIFESLACGTPCIHGNYGGAPEFMPKSMLVEPAMYHYETPYNVRRPVYVPSEWVKVVESVLYHHRKAALPPELDWNALWPRFEKWFRRGVTHADATHP